MKKSQESQLHLYARNSPRNGLQILSPGIPRHTKAKYMSMPVDTVPKVHSREGVCNASIYQYIVCCHLHDGIVCGVAPHNCQFRHSYQLSVGTPLLCLPGEATKVHP